MAITNGEDKARAGIIGRHPTLLAALASATRVAPTSIPVLVTGETGTGKDLLARLIHEHSRQARGPLVTVNCGTLPRELADSQLFGHERGAFTGAGGRRIGCFEEANGGTLVLDEIGELPLEVQPKLLRVLEAGQVRRLGGRGEIAVNVRVVALTLRDLRREIAWGTFREDLFHRLAGFEIALPALRERAEDIPLLVEWFWARAAANERPARLSPAAIKSLMEHAWPGNIRELRNVLMRAATLSGETIAAGDLEQCLGPLAGRGAVAAPWEATPPPHGGVPQEAWRPPRSVGRRPTWRAPLSSETLRTPRLADGADGLPYRDPPRQLSDLVVVAGRSFHEIEREVLDGALVRSGGNRRGAARSLAMPRSTFTDRARRHGVLP